MNCGEGGGRAFGAPLRRLGEVELIGAGAAGETEAGQAGIEDHLPGLGAGKGVIPPGEVCTEEVVVDGPEDLAGVDGNGGQELAGFEDLAGCGDDVADVWPGKGKRDTWLPHYVT